MNNEDGNCDGNNCESIDENKHVVNYGVKVIVMKWMLNIIEDMTNDVNDNISNHMGNNLNDYLSNDVSDVESE